MASVNSNNVPESELRKMLNVSLGPQGRRRESLIARTAAEDPFRTWPASYNETIGVRDFTFMDIDLHINNVIFALGEHVDRRKLTLAKCDKAGLLHRLVLKPPSSQVIYWAKNCEIACFRGEFVVWANLDRSSGADRMSGTSAYLYFKNFILESVKFQVLLNETMAIGATAQFQGLCENAFGTPASDSPAYWRDSEAVVSCSLFHTRDRALFVWKTRRHMEEHGLSG